MHLVSLSNTFTSLQVKSKLKGHSKRITGLAFSNILNVLVSSGADAQVDNLIKLFLLLLCCLGYNARFCFLVGRILRCSMNIILISLIYVICQLCVWSSVGWEMQKSRFLQLPSRRLPEAPSETRVQFHLDQIHFLVIHETQLGLYETTKLDCTQQVHFVSLLPGHWLRKSIQMT